MKACLFCLKEGVLSCSCCKSAQYCSIQCQRNDWSRHKNLCKSKSKLKFEAVNLKSKYGTSQVGMIAKEPIKKGQLIYQSSPFLYVALEAFGEEETIKKYYEETGLDKNKYFSSPSEITGKSELAIELSACLAALYPNRVKQILKNFPDPNNKILLDYSNNEVLNIFLSYLMDMSNKGNCAKLDGEELELSYEDVLILCKHVQSYYFMHESMSTDIIGAVYDPLIGLFNHSCNPNVHWEMTAEEITLIAIKDIKKGEEVTFSYFFTAYGVFSKTELFNAVLLQCGFECKCDIHSKSYKYKGLPGNGKLPKKLLKKIRSRIASPEKNENVKSIYNIIISNASFFSESELFNPYESFKWSLFFLANIQEMIRDNKRENWADEAYLKIAELFGYCIDQIVDPSPSMIVRAAWARFESKLIQFDNDIKKRTSNSNSDIEKYVEYLKLLKIVNDIYEKLYIQLVLAFKRHKNDNMVERYISTALANMDPRLRIHVDAILKLRKKNLLIKLK